MSLWVQQCSPISRNRTWQTGLRVFDCPSSRPMGYMHRHVVSRKLMRIGHNKSVSSHLLDGLCCLDGHGTLLNHNLAACGDRGDHACSPLPVGQVGCLARAHTAGLGGGVDAAGQEAECQPLLSLMLNTPSGCHSPLQHARSMHASWWSRQQTSWQAPIQKPPFNNTTVSSLGLTLLPVGSRRLQASPTAVSAHWRGKAVAQQLGRAMCGT